MKLRLFSRNPDPDKVAALYGAIVAQARQPAFYRDYGVADSLEGRLEMLILHLALVFERLQSVPQELARTGQAAFDLFCQDMDDQLREMGVGDLGVPKKMRRIATAFYSRQAGYRAALIQQDDVALKGIFADNLPVATVLRTDALIQYARAAERVLAAQAAEAIVSGQLIWPDAGHVANTPAAV